MPTCFGDVGRVLRVGSQRLKSRGLPGVVLHTCKQQEIARKTSSAYANMDVYKRQIRLH